MPGRPLWQVSECDSTNVGCVNVKFARNRLEIFRKICQKWLKKSSKIFDESNDLWHCFDATRSPNEFYFQPLDNYFFKAVTKEVESNLRGKYENNASM